MTTNKRRYERHHLTGTRIYRAWKNMRIRCLNNTTRDWSDWGGRGIVICKRWDSVLHFLSDMGHPKKGMTLERIDNNGDYSPTNCAWRSSKEQAQNTRRNIKLTYQGRTMCLTAWAEILGINPRTLHGRLFTEKKTIKEAFTLIPSISNRWMSQRRYRDQLPKGRK